MATLLNTFDTRFASERLRRRVMAATMIEATNIVLTETSTAARKAWALKALRSPSSTTDLVMWFIASKGSLAEAFVAAGNDSDVTDANIRNLVGSAITAMTA